MDSATESLADAIERSTMRRLTMQTNLEDGLSRCNPQTDSPLYRSLPKEIRDLIFAFATAQHEVLDKKYKDTAFHARPGHIGPLASCTNLLLTCRRTWLETYALPLEQAEFTIWKSAARGPPSPRNQAMIAQDLTPLNKRCFTKLHFFLQMYEANSMFQLDTAEMPGLRDARPTVLHITIRHTDWFWWERGAPLKLDDYWVQRILNSPDLESVQKFQLELETLVSNKSQLDTIVEKLSALKGAVHRGPTGMNRQFVVKDVSEPWRWTGPTTINDMEYAPYVGLKQLDYYVVTITWKSIATRAEPTVVPEQPAIEARGTHNFPCQVHSSNHTFRSRGFFLTVYRPLRRRLLGHEWRGHEFPVAHHLMEQESHQRAVDTENQMRWHFDKEFGDIEARRLERLWAEQGSLLKFEG